MKVKLGDVFERHITGEWGNECSENEPGAKVLRTTNFTSSGEIDFKNVVMRSINKSKVQSKRLHYGDIILEKSGGTEKTPVGRVVFCDESIENDIYLCNNFTQTMRVNQVVGYPRYVFYFMWYLHYSGKTDLLQNKTTGIRNLQLKSYLNEELPLPSLDEQRRIAAVLDKVSDLIAKRRAQMDKLDELVKARFVEMFGDPERNPKHWPVLSMNQTCKVGSSKRIYKSEHTSNGIPFLRVSNLTDLINTGMSTPDLYIPEELYNELKNQGQVPTAGDILLTSRGTLGQCYIVKENDEFYFQDGMISWLSNFSDCITPLYLSYLFAMPGFRRQIESIQAGTTVSYLSISMINRLSVMLPTMELQISFSSFVKHTDGMKLTIQQSLDKLEMLKKTLMQGYFG